jgi:hypothetical protein
MVAVLFKHPQGQQADPLATFNSFNKLGSGEIFPLHNNLHYISYCVIRKNRYPKSPSPTNPYVLRFTHYAIYYFNISGK